MPRIPRSRADWLAPIAVFVATAAVYGCRLGALGLTEPDEARYAAVGRAMLSTRDLVTPCFNGFVYLDKPPLLHWLTAAAFAVGGVCESSARAVSVLAAAAGTALVYAFGRAAFGARAGLVSAAVLASSLLWFVMGRVLRFDMLLTLSVTATLYSAWIAVETGERGRRYWLLSTAAAGLGTLVKGPVALVLPAMVLFPYLAITRQLPALRRVPWLACLALLAAIVAPWCILCERASPGAMRFILLQENLARAAGEVGESHARPWWYLLAILPAAVLPWVLCLPGAAIDACGPRSRGQAADWRASVLLLLWLASPVVLFSIPTGKLFGYVLPALPAAALLIGRYLSNAHERSRPATIATGGLLIGASVALQTVGLRPIAQAGYPTDPPVPLTAAALLLGGLGVVVLGAMRRPGSAIGVTVACVLGAYHIAVRAAELAQPPVSERALARQVAALRRPGERVVAYGRMSRGVLFYLNEPVIVVGHMPGEYDFPGNLARLKGWHYDRDEAGSLFAASPAAIGTARVRDWEELRGRLPDRVRLLARVGKNVVFRTVPGRDTGQEMPAATPK